MLAWMVAPLVVGGCAAKHKPAADAPTPLPVVADGDWHGTSTRFQADARHCPGPNLLDVPVLNNSFDYRWMPGVDIIVSIARDGTLSGSNGDVTVKGKVTGSRMEGDATSAACGLHFTLTRTP